MPAEIKTQDELTIDRKHHRFVGYLLTFSSILNILLAVVVLLGVALIAFTFTMKPIVISEMYSVPRWHRVQDFHLKYDYIDTFLKVTTSQIFSHHSKEILGLEPYSAWISPFVQFLYKQEYYNTHDPRFYKWQSWEILRFKRYTDPTAPRLMAFIVDGMITRVTGSEVSENIRMKVEPRRVFYIFYVAQSNPTPNNPYGLTLVGYREVKERSDQRLIYDQAYDVIGTKDSFGNTILPSDPPPRAPVTSDKSKN